MSKALREGEVHIDFKNGSDLTGVLLKDNLESLEVACEVDICDDNGVKGFISEVVHFISKSDISSVVICKADYEKGLRIDVNYQ